MNDMIGMPNNSNKTTLFKSFAKTWRNFWNNTSISGLSNANGTSSRWRRYLWISIFAAFAVLTIVGLNDVFKDYTAYPVITSVTVKNNNQVKIINFPCCKFKL